MEFLSEEAMFILTEAGKYEPGEIQRRACLAEGTAGAKALGQEGVWALQGTASRPVGVECSEEGDSSRPCVRTCDRGHQPSCHHALSLSLPPSTPCIIFLWLLLQIITSLVAYNAHLFSSISGAAHTTASRADWHRCVVLATQMLPAA